MKEEAASGPAEWCAAAAKDSFATGFRRVCGMVARARRRAGCRRLEQSEGDDAAARAEEREACGVLGIL